MRLFYGRVQTRWFIQEDMPNAQKSAAVSPAPSAGAGTSVQSRFHWEIFGPKTADITTKTTRTSFGETLKLLAVVFPPILALAGISFLVIFQARRTMEDSVRMRDHLMHSDDIRKLVHVMQRERGVTCIYLSYKG